MKRLGIAGLLALALAALIVLLGGGAEDLATEAAARPDAPGAPRRGALPADAPTLAVSPPGSTSETERPQRAAIVLPARVLGEVVGELPRGAHVVAEDAAGPRRVELLDRRFALETSTLGPLTLRLEGIPRCVSEPVRLDVARLGVEYAATLVVTPLPRLGIRFVDASGTRISTIARRAVPMTFEPLVAIATSEPPASPPGHRRKGDDEVWSELGTYELRGGKWPTPEGEEIVCGTLAIDVPLPVVVSAVLGNHVLASRTVHDDARVVEFLLDDTALAALRIRVRGRLVRAEDGTPIADTPALAVVRERSPRNRWVLASTDEEGRFDFDDLPRVPLFLVVDVDGREHLQLPLDDTRNVVDLGDVPVPESVALSGHALDPAGARVQAPLVWVGTVGARARDRAWHGRMGGGLEREDGWFSVFQLPCEPLVLGMWPEPDRAARSVVVDGAPGGLIDVRLEVVEGVPVSIFCAQPDGVELLDDRGFLVWSFAEGAFLQCHLAPGDYLLTDGRRSQGLTLAGEPVDVRW